MKRKPSPVAPKRRRPAPGDRRSSPSFEILLEEVLAKLSCGPDSDAEAGVQAALDRVAAYFSADLAVVRLANDPRPPAAGLGDGGSTLEVEIVGRDRQPLGKAVLCSNDRRRAWVGRDERRFRSLASVLLNALRLQRTREERRENQIPLVMALESATVGTWDWNIVTDGVRYITPFERRTGEVEVRETTGASWFETTHPQDIPAARAEVERAISGASDTFSFVVRSLRPPYRSGEWFPIYSRGRVVERDANGRATRIMGVFEDVAEAVQRAEQEREREAELAKTTRMASLGALASSVAHEINQPLAALTGFLEAAVRLLGQGEAKRAEVTDALRRSVALAEKASEIVRRLRRLLRREHPVQEPIGIPDALQHVREQLAREARAAGVEVSVLHQERTKTIRGDRVQIEQVLVNLVRNAIEALAGSDRSPKLVTLAAVERDAVIELRVSDNGPGISDADAGRLFDPFFTTKSAGSGLGLVVCQSIAEVHGGRIRLDRTGPDGTTFVLELPFGEESDP